jgi:perosamine synthetase
MDPILEIAKERRILVVEDAAEAHGARYKGRRVGGLGDIGIFSFYGNKILTTGEGGMVVTSEPEFAEKVRFYKDHAMDPKRRYWHPEVGFNYRMTNLQAAIGCAQLSRFEELLLWRRRLIDWYRAEFMDAVGVSFNPCREWAEPVPWMVCCLLCEGTTQEDRDHVMEVLRQAGVDSRPYFHPLCDMPPYTSYRTVGGPSNVLPVVRDLSARGLNLPMSHRLRRQDVCRIRRAFGTL